MDLSFFILYTLVAGRSGTNKSGALHLISNIVRKVFPDSTFDTGTLEGLAAKMKECNGSVICINDEFLTFLQTIEPGKRIQMKNQGFYHLIADPHGARRSKPTDLSHLKRPISIC